MSQDLIDQIRQRARKNFSLGFNCSECVFEAVISNIDTGLPPDVKKLATGFGGGIGLYGDTCGAIAGGVLAISAVHGRSELPEGNGREAVQKAVGELYGNPGLYRLFNQLPNRIKEKYGKTLCRELTEPWQNQWLCREHALHCREIITDAAQIAAELALAEREEASSQPFGENVESLKD